MFNSMYDNAITMKGKVRTYYQNRIFNLQSEYMY